jgi:hypothetical protein
MGWCTKRVGPKADTDVWAYLKFFVSMIASVEVAMSRQDMR